MLILETQNTFNVSQLDAACRELGPLEDSANEALTDITEDLQAALAQFVKIASDLKR